jgi:hypothetical protein
MSMMEGRFGIRSRGNRRGSRIPIAPSATSTSPICITSSIRRRGRWLSRITAIIIGFHFLEWKLQKEGRYNGGRFQKVSYLLGISKEIIQFSRTLSIIPSKFSLRCKNTTEKLKAKKKINGYSIQPYEFSF